VSVAALLSVVVARFANRALGTLLLADTVSAPPIDLRTVALAAAVATCTCVGCALASVVRAVRTDPRAALGSRSRTATSSHRRPLRLLVAAQIALGVVLVSEAAVFVASLKNAGRVDLGFDLDRLVVADVDLRAAGFTAATAPGAASRALDAVRRIPGVADAGMTNAMTIPGYLNYSVAVPGQDSAPPGIDEGEPFVNAITPGFLEALAVSVTRGRLPSDEDVTAARPVALVSERFARLYWPREDAIGQCVRLGRSTAVPCAEVVGVVGDRRNSPGAEHGVAELYLPARSTAFPEQLARTFLGREIAVRVDGARDITSELQRRLLDVLPGLTSVRVRVGDAYLEAQTRSWRLGAVVIGAFAGIALALAAVGVFSVWSHAVASRRRELGIRGALGARPSDLAWLIGREALGVAVVGLLVGIVGAMAAARVVRSLAFGISPLDPRVLAVSGGVCLIVTCAAAVVPAARAALTNPRSVLASD
jgi:putative ABC transport system permease protein